MVVRISRDSCAFLCVLNQMFVEILLLVCMRSLGRDCFLRNTNKNFSILDRASIVALKTQPVSYAACLRVWPIEFEECSTDTAVADQVVSAANTKLEQVFWGAFQFKDEAFWPLGLLTREVLSLFYNWVEDDWLSFVLVFNSYSVWWFWSFLRSWRLFFSHP